MNRKYDQEDEDAKLSTFRREVDSLVNMVKTSQVMGRSVEMHVFFIAYIRGQNNCKHIRILSSILIRF